MKKRGKFSQSLAKNGPTIVLGLGIASMVIGTVLAVYETPKALDDIKDLEEEKKKEKDPEPITKKEIVKATWKRYIFPLTTEVVGMGLIIQSHRMMNNRVIAFATAYSGLETAHMLYQKNARDILGEKKEQEIRDAVAKERVPAKIDNVISLGGNTLCYDPWTERLFYSDQETIRRAINNLNKQMMDECYISLNEYYYEIGLKDVKCGDLLGWHIDQGLIDVSFSSQLTKDGRPCLVIDFLVEPVYDYSRSLF